MIEYYENIHDSFDITNAVDLILIAIYKDQSTYILQHTLVDNNKQPEINMQVQKKKFKQSIISIWFWWLAVMAGHVLMMEFVMKNFMHAPAYLLTLFILFFVLDTSEIIPSNLQ